MDAVTEPHDAAFARPASDPRTDELPVSQQGLTKREYFAGQAVRFMLAGSPPRQGDIDDAAEFAVAYADALIAELNK